MKKFLLLMSVFVILSTNYVYADEEVIKETFVSGFESSELATPPSEERESFTYYSDSYDADINAVINNPDASDNDLLRALLVCVKDLDVYVRFFVTMVFAIGLVYFVILKPIRYFLI